VVTRRIVCPTFSQFAFAGDRFSWTGDAHVAQATAMASLGNFDFVRQNLFFTKDNCNGIESYCLYYVLSVFDYFVATNDTATAVQLSPHVVPKLERACVRAVLTKFVMRTRSQRVLQPQPAARRHY
jgi:sarcosine oxidase delta subunit